MDSLVTRVNERLPGFIALCHTFAYSVVIDHAMFTESHDDLLLLGAAVKYAAECGKTVHVVSLSHRYLANLAQRSGGYP